MNRIDRLLGYLLVFQNRELVRAQDLAARFEVSERTVYRDVEALCEVGVPLYGTPGEGYRLLEGYYLPPVTFSEAEARAIFLAISMLTSLTESGPTQQAATDALDKIRAVLPKATRAQAEALQAMIGFYAITRPPLNLDDPKFAQLLSAIEKRRVVRLHYHAQHSNEVTQRNVEPLHLVFLDNAWILGAYCRMRQDQRNFRLDRIDSLTMLRETFAPRPRSRGSLDRGDLHVIVRFDDDIVRWVREDQHFTFHAEEQDAQGVRMHYQVREFQQIRRWLLGWGAQAEVISPPALRAEILHIAQQQVAQLSTAPT